MGSRLFGIGYCSDYEMNLRRMAEFPQNSLVYSVMRSEFVRMVVAVLALCVDSCHRCSQTDADWQPVYWG